MNQDNTPEKRRPREWEIERMRPSGPGGQHMQKTESKVRVRWNFSVANISEEDREKLLEAFPDGYVEATSQKTRSQRRNIALAHEKIKERVEKVLAPRKERIPTEAPPTAKKRRIEEKKKISEKKKLRSRVEFEEE
jgi:ribosome-associated protein